MPAKPTIHVRKAADLKPDPRNARTHSADQIAQIAGLIDRFGWTNPIIADDLIRAGHGRREAALLIYRDPEAVIHMAPGRAAGGVALPKGAVPVIDCSGWSEDERRAYVLADNQVAENAGWDFAVLQGELDALAAVDFDVGTIGFDDDALAAIAEAASAGGGSGRGAPDEFPTFGDDIETTHTCPKCSYRWSGPSK